MKRFVGAVALFVVVACASAHTGGNVEPRGNRDVLTQSEIDSRMEPGMSAYELIQHARPQFFKMRGVGNLSPTSVTAAMPVVYIDNVRTGSIDQLKQISGGNVARIQYLSSIDATTRFGTDHSGGAILLTTR
jgi:hypothetical protein